MADIYNGTFKWFLQKYKDDPSSYESLYKPKNKNRFTPYFSGQEIFGNLAHSIVTAKSTVDIIAWGFDPAMCLLRPAKNWDLSNTYGEILKLAAKKNVTIRLLIWYNPKYAFLAKNIVGIMPLRRNGTKTYPRNADAANYSKGWFDEIQNKNSVLLPRKPAQPFMKNIQVEFRSIAGRVVLNDEDDRTFGEVGAHLGATDHQKTVMIDYGADNAHGYLMGHNSLTEYWDTKAMKHYDPLREMGEPPYHDFSVKIEGDCLADLNHNFCQAWDTFASPPKDGISLTQARKKMTVKSVGKSSGQIVRTRPDKQWHGKQEKEIKRAYMQVAQNARKFMLITNQYMQYPRWARHLSTYLQKAKNAGFPRELYLFIITCEPEKDGMVFRAHEMANELGVSDQFTGAEKEIYNVKNKYALTKQGEKWKAKQKKLKADLAKVGINTVFCMLKTKIAKSSQTPQDIYVHAKLLVVDDAYITLGSANLNTRSMAVDSEINLLSNDHSLASTFRQTLFNMYMGGAVKVDINKNTRDFFREFSDHVQKNKKLVEAKTAIIGHAVPFSDPRSGSAINVN